MLNTFIGHILLSSRCIALISGNALCAWAALLPPPAALPLLQRAVEAYTAALALEEDAATLSNLGDALVQRAEVLCDVGGGEHEQQVRLRC